MAATCDTCGRGLSFTQRARGRNKCDHCLAAEKEAASRALAEFPAAMAAVVNSGGSAAPAVDRMRALERAMVLGGTDPLAQKSDYYRSFLDRALADEVLTANEERVIDQVARALFPGAEENAQMSVLRDYRAQLFIAMVNDGRLPELPASGMVMKKNEVMHLEEPAALMKEVIHREFRSGSRGVSFRIMKGVSYRVGASRGQMVEVGRSLVVADSGTLSLTSLRAVFAGERKTIEMSYAKLLDLNVYTDGIQFHLSGRQNPPMFRVASGPMVAAVVNTASQRLM